MSKPKLELKINEPTKIKLLQTDCVTGESNFGKWFLYNVLAEGKEQSFFPPEQVVKYIQENSLKKGDELSITKSLTKNGKSNVINFKMDFVTKENEQDIKPDENGKSDDIKIMRECLMAGIQLQKELGSVVDVNKISMSLYIARIKNQY